MKKEVKDNYKVAQKMGKDFGVSLITVKNDEVLVGVDAIPRSFRTKKGIRFIKPEIIITEPTITPIGQSRRISEVPNGSKKNRITAGDSIGVEWKAGNSIFAVAGTGGFIAQHPIYGKVLVTNAHVIQHARHWEKVTSPSRADGGIYEINGIGTVVHLSIYHDVALIKLIDGLEIDNLVNGLPFLKIGSTGFKNRVYEKFGRTTGHTKLKESEYTNTNIMHPSIAGLMMKKQDLFVSADNRKESDMGDSGSGIFYFNSTYWEAVSHLWGSIIIENKHYTIGDPIMQIFKDENLYLLNQEMPEETPNVMQQLTVKNLIVESLKVN